MSSNSSGNKVKRGVRNTQNVISIIFLSLVSIMALSLCIALLIRNATLQRQEEAVRSELDALNSEGYYTQEEADRLVENAREESEKSTLESVKNLIKSMLESGESPIAAIRALFLDQLVVGDSGKYYFFPITDDIEHHGFTEDDFEFDEKGFLKYIGEDDLQYKTGIDVSRFQGDIDWEKVAADGIDFAIIRAGLRGTTEGKLLYDDCFEDNVKGALENGIEVGVYFYSQAVNEEEVKEEAQMMLDIIEPYDITYPVVIDVESAESTDARTSDMTPDEYEAVVSSFCDIVRTAGYTPMVYGNVKSFTLLMDAASVDDYDIWIAYYGLPLYYPYHFDMWQYTSTGKVNGIDGDVDINICITDY